MNVTTHERPGVYSVYGASSLVRGSGGRKTVGLAAVNTKAEAGVIQTITSYEEAVSTFGSQADSQDMAELIRVILLNGAAAVLLHLLGGCELLQRGGADLRASPGDRRRWFRRGRRLPSGQAGGHLLVHRPAVWPVSGGAGRQKPADPEPESDPGGREGADHLTGYVITAQGVTTILPAPVSWCFQYTSGVPCDSFRLRCIWDGDNQVRPEEWALFQALEGGEVQFTGVVDECETVLGPEGAFFEVSGRGMAARLLDNEALSQDYELAAPADILRDHVEPYGIQTEGGAALGPVSRFSVAAGSSEWAVLYEFARYHNGICPRFDREGRLILSPWPDTREIALDDAVPVERLSCRVRRYGVLSQVVVRDRYQNRTETVENPAFQALGGHRRQVVTMPGKSQYQAMRYSGRFQLERSAAEQLWIQAEIPMLFFAQPGDLVRLERSNWGRNGRYRVMEAQVGQDESGGWTRLELAPPDVIL